MPIFNSHLFNQANFNTGKVPRVLSDTLSLADTIRKRVKKVFTETISWLDTLIKKFWSREEMVLHLSDSSGNMTLMLEDSSSNLDMRLTEEGGGN